jgi:hypothetical protein
MLIVGGSGEIWKSTDLGTNWTKKTSGVNAQLRSVSSDHGSTTDKLVCGNNGTVLKSNDGGETWSNISPGISTNFRSAINASDKIHVVGLGGSILLTADGGANWFAQDSPTSNDLNDIVEIDNGDLVAVGAGGTILVYSELTGVENTKNNPAAFSVAQNYPNPFNPSTRIRYSIPHSSSVSIKVYDLIGNEIQTLVNEEKPGGSYEITWNAYDLPSGVYFYQIRAGEFFQTNKMLLLK